MQNQRGFAGVGVLIAILVALAVLGGGAYYVVQQQVPSQTAPENFDTVQTVPTQNTASNQASNPQPAPKENPPKSQNSQTYSKMYTNSEFGISFSHPDDWQCKTSKTSSAHPDWYQSTCDNDGVWKDDPFFAISVPFVAEDHELWTKVREVTIVGQNSSSIKKTVYRSAGFGGSIGMVEYIFSGSASTKSYSAFALYGSGKPYKTAEEAETVLDEVVKTLVVKLQTNPISQSSSDLKIYSNAQYGFSVQYPSDASYSLANPGRFLNGSVSFTTNAGTQSSGRLDMGFPLPLERCDVPKTDASHTAPTDLRYESIGGISFAAYTNTSAPASANYIEKIYQGLRGSECYFFVETITSASLTERTQIEAKLDAVVRSFRFN